EALNRGLAAAAARGQGAQRMTCPAACSRQLRAFAHPTGLRASLRTTPPRHRQRDPLLLAERLVRVVVRMRVGGRRRRHAGVGDRLVPGQGPAAPLAPPPPPPPRPHPLPPPPHHPPL